MNGGKRILNVIGVVGALVLGGYLYVSSSIVTDPTSKPSCSVDASMMVSLINKYRSDHHLAPMIENKFLDNIAKDLSDKDGQYNSMNLSMASITEATKREGYNSATLTYQVYPSTDSTVNGYIFKEMMNTETYKNAVLDKSLGQVGVYSNCSTDGRTITVRADNPSQASIDNQQIKVNTLTYLVYDH